MNDGYAVAIASCLGFFAPTLIHQMKIISLIGLCLLGFALRLQADVAPTTFVGGTIAPANVTGLRFEDAKVIITWGTMCDLDAEFEIVSELKKPVSQEIGFPVGGLDPVYNYDQGKDAPGDSKVSEEVVGEAVISIHINGAKAEAFRRMKVPENCEIRGGHASWYFTNAILVPGLNRIHIKTRLQPSGVSGRPYQRTLEYCVWTGGRWNGKIKHERIEIVFPYQIGGNLIQEMKPWFMKTEGKRLVWECKDIEPNSDYYDIKLVLLLPEVDALLQEMEKAYEEKHHDARSTLRLARHLFLLGDMKGNSGFPPSKLSITEYYQILGQLQGKERAALVSHYNRFSEESVHERTSDWTAERISLIKILADVGFCRNYPGVHFPLRAKLILEDLLGREPNNEAAWLLYLNNYWRFSFAATGHWFGKTAMGAGQQAALQKAQMMCPKSELLRNWTIDASEQEKKAKDPLGEDPFLQEVKRSEFDAILKDYPAAL